MAVAIGKVLRAKREKLDVSQEQFAERVSLSKNYIGIIERGEPVIEWHKCRLVSLSPELTGAARCRFVRGDFFALAASGHGFDPTEQLSWFGIHWPKGCGKLSQTETRLRLYGGASHGLEPDEGKLSSPVLRGGGGSNAASLPDLSKSRSTCGVTCPRLILLAVNPQNR